jgi:hypothetical protein
LPRLQPHQAQSREQPSSTTPHTQQWPGPARPASLTGNGFETSARNQHSDSLYTSAPTQSIRTCRASILVSWPMPRISTAAAAFSCRSPANAVPGAAANLAR